MLDCIFIATDFFSKVFIMKDKSKDFSMQGLKIHVDSKKNIIDSNFFLRLVNDLTLINNLFVDGDRFVAGYQLGRLQGDLVFLMEQLEEKEKWSNTKGNEHV